MVVSSLATAVSIRAARKARSAAAVGTIAILARREPELASRELKQEPYSQTRRLCLKAR